MISLLFATSSLLVFPRAMPAAAAATQAVCTAPVTYSLDTLDPRFKLTRDEAAGVLSNAAALWNGVKSGVLSAGTGSNAVKVSFVYDERQQQEESIQSQRVTLQKQVKDFNTIASAVRVLADQLNALQASHEAKGKSLEARQSQYESDVAAINAKGGGSKEEVAHFNSVYKTLLAEQDSYNRKVAEINAVVAGVNTLSNFVHAKQASLQVSIDGFNADLAKTPNPEAGLYEKNAKGTFISIFAYPDKNNLTRVVAHEFGHSLGLQHITEEGSIMNALNTGEDIVLAQGDLTEWQRVCGR